LLDSLFFPKLVKYKLCNIMDSTFGWSCSTYLLSISSQHN
jgi:hypothetical protein